MSQTRKKLYWERKLAGPCVDCAAGLTDDDTGVRCVECRAAEVQRQTKYKNTERGRTKYNAAARRRHSRRALAGRCVDCCKPSLTHKRCAACRQRRKERQAWSEPADRSRPGRRAA